MATIRVNPTRMEMKKLQARYATARKGHKLLKDKRDELMRQFLEVVREDKELRKSIEGSLADAYRNFTVASAVMGKQALEEALIFPKNECELRVSYKNMMNVTVPVFEGSIHTGEGNNGYNYGLVFTSGELDGAVDALGGLTKDLLRMAELEKTAQLLAEEIERTRRRVNALEYILMPQYLEAIRSIRMKLDENERGNTTRLMKVKDMMLAEKLVSESDEEEEA